MEFIKHYSKLEDCNFIEFMESTGIAYARAYTFDDDKITFYLDRLSVNIDYQLKGIGTKLQIIREQIAKENGYKYVKLWVKKGTWMRAWYKRRGYMYDSPYKEQNAVWLRKLI